MKGLLPLLLVAFVSTASDASIVEEYLEHYFRTYPSQATAAGRHDLDGQLEGLAAAARQVWIERNHAYANRLRSELLLPDLDPAERIDHELLLRVIERELFDFEILQRPQRDPLFWSEILANATVLLLVRDDLPLKTRLRSAIARAEQLPRLAAEARLALASAGSSEVAREHSALARRQVAGAASFYRHGFVQTVGPEESELRPALERAGAVAAEALETLEGFLADLERRATGTPRLGSIYAARFRLVTGIDDPVIEVLDEARAALAAKVEETAVFARGLWGELMPGKNPPEDDSSLLRLLFERLSADRAGSTEEFIDDYRHLVAESVDFVRRLEIITLPEPLTLHVDRSPSYFVGQSVGGVYPAGPYAAPDAKTILFLPTPAEDSTVEQRDAFFRDFNHHFNVMITPHELIPGHYLQLKYAARHPRKVRALFGDGVYIEGWGTFCERLMLDLGWGGPMDRLAHLKKQLENIARIIVDIRVHTEGVSRDEILRFVQQEALQDRQFADNMWIRAITSSPQLTFYYLGYREVHGLYLDLRAALGEDFDLRKFMDGMMELGPVPVRHYRARMLAEVTE